MKRISISFALSLLCLCSAFAQSFADLLKSADYAVIVRPPDGEGYVATVVLKNGECSLLYESEGAVPTILGIQKQKDMLRLIIKQRWTGDKEFTPGVGRKASYYIVAVTQSNILKNTQEINAAEELKRPSLQLWDPSLLLEVQVNDKAVNVRSGSGIIARRIAQVDWGERFAVMQIADGLKSIQGRTDYWFHVKNTKLEGWVFGYYLDGQNKVSLN
jgi:hypothetical protein